MLLSFLNMAMDGIEDGTFICFHIIQFKALQQKANSNGIFKEAFGNYYEVEMKHGERLMRPCISLQ